MLIRRLVVTALMRVAQNPAVQKKAGEVAGKALDAARPSLLRTSRKAGEFTRKAVKKILDDRWAPLCHDKAMILQMAKPF